MSRLYTILNTLAQIAKRKDYSSLGAWQDITSYNTQSNLFTVPNDGLVRVFCSYRSGSYGRASLSNGETLLQISAPTNSGLQGNNVVTAQVIKGQKIYCEVANSYSSVQYAPYILGGGTA